MPYTELSFTMKNRLSSIMHDYQDKNDLNDYTNNHISHITYLLSMKPYKDAVFWLGPYKLDIQLAIDFHKEHVGDFPKNTYSKLTKIFEQF